MPPPPSHAAHPNPSTPAPPQAAAAANGGADAPRHHILSIIPLFGFGFLTYNSIAAISRSIHDPWTVAFVSVSYADLVLLYYCFRLVELTAASDVHRRARLKAAVWLLAFLLTTMFTYRVAAIMPPAVAVLVWALSAVTIAGGFYAMFLYREAPEKEVTAAEKNPDAFDKC